MNCRACTSKQDELTVLRRENSKLRAQIAEQDAWEEKAIADFTAYHLEIAEKDARIAQLETALRDLIAECEYPQPCAQDGEPMCVYHAMLAGSSIEPLVIVSQKRMDELRAYEALQGEASQPSQIESGGLKTTESDLLAAVGYAYDAFSDWLVDTQEDDGHHPGWQASRAALELLTPFLEPSPTEQEGDGK